MNQRDRENYIGGDYNEDIQSFIAVIDALKGTADQPEEHAKAAIESCRLSRRIRMRLGNPYTYSMETRSEVAGLFLVAAELISGEECAEYTKNVHSRAMHLLHPERIEEELFAEENATAEDGVKV